MNAQTDKVTTRSSLIRITISILIATICLAFAGCGEHAEPLDLDGPLSWVNPGTDAH